MAAGFTWLQHYVRGRAFDEGLAQVAVVYMQAGGRERCEMAPGAWTERFHPRPPPRNGRPPETWLFAYDARLSSENPAAPALRDAVDAAAFATRDTSFVRLRHAATNDVLVRMPWVTGPCAMVLVQHRAARDHIIPPLEVVLLPPAIALISLLFALGPVIRRIRGLTREVHRSAADLYATPITVGGSDEIGELARAFDNAGRDVRNHVAMQEQRERTLRNFLENTTHDITIPLTVLQGHIAQLQQHAKAGTPADASIAHDAMNEVHYIASLLHNLGIAAKLEGGAPQMRRGPVDLNALVRRAVGRHNPVAKESRIALAHAVPEATLWTDADVTLVEQAISNVIYNAVRHNRPGGHVGVTLDAVGHERFILHVIDDGPGLAEDDLQRLSERYFRGDAARSRYPNGQGLGLTISSDVCRLHDWHLAFSRSSFGGLHVEFTGPLTHA